MTTPTITMKRCPKCGETKPLDSFYRNRSQRDGLTCQCKECHRANRLAYNKANREKVIEQKRAYREANRETLRARSRAYDAAHREERRAYQHQYQQTAGHPTVEKWVAVTAKKATRKSKIWTEAEDNYLAESTGRMIDEALALNRTFHAVASRRKILRKRGVILARDAH